MIGLKCAPEAHIALRERIDFAILVSVFSALVGALVTFLLISFHLTILALASTLLPS